MTQEEAESIRDGLLIQMQLVSMIDNERALARVSWSSYGILDAGTTSKHVVDITVNSISIPGFPLTLTGSQAYDADYSILVDMWDPNKEYQVKVVVNDAVESISVFRAPLGAGPNPEKQEFQHASVRALLSNNERGVQVKIGGCDNCAKQIRNVTISKSIGVSSTPVDTFTSSVPFSYNMPILESDFVYLIKDNLKIPITTLEFDNIFYDRAEILVYGISSTQVYLEVIDPLKIASYAFSRTVDVSEFSALNPTIHNDVNVIYKALLEDLYYEFIQYETMIPSQPTQSSPSITSSWGDLQGFTLGNTTFDVYIDGTRRDITDTVTFLSAIRNSKKDFTSYGLNSLDTSPAIETLLPSGVTFMDESFLHNDVDVVDGVVYKYKVTVETLNGDSFVVFNGVIERITPTRGALPSGVSEESLALPVNVENTLNEKDFVSGTAVGALKITLSDNPAEYLQYLINEERGKNKCLI